MAAAADPVVLPESALDCFPRFSLYNSPYPAHERGCAVDLYPGVDPAPGADEPAGPDDAGTAAPSPVSGEVLETRTVRAPEKPYAGPHDHLILVACDDDSPGTTPDTVARILHVDPGVAAGDHVAVGDSLGTTVRSGFFAPWVANHLHVGFRDPDANLHRAAGSLPLAVDAAVDPLAWDGTGTVVETGDTYAVLDAPAHPAPGEHFAGIGASADGVTAAAGVALDGGLPHYDGGGLLGTGDQTAGAAPGDRVSLLGTRVGEVVDGRSVAWDDVTVLADGDPIHGLSLFASRGAVGAKLVCPDRPFAVGERVAVTVAGADD